MKLTLAGHNIDSSLVPLVDNATPESISAAYAKISRSNKSVSELRQDGLTNVKNSREINEKIVFGFGHCSVAEHAVFDIDVENLSRLATEEIQRHRFISFTEKSQRYVKLNDTEFITVPEELYEYKEEILDLHRLQFVAYTAIHNRIQDYLAFNLTISKEDRISANEDARYVLPLSIHTNLG
jgi:flavin-dependent thymidylate synthase